MTHTPKVLKQWALLAVACGALAAVTVGAQTTSTATTSATKPAADSSALSKLIAQYTPWAGSKENAKSLVQGLNTGSSVTLSGTGSGTSSTFTPATSKLGVGEVGIALSLAKASLAQQGITNPTPAQLSAALNGGVITSSTSTTSVAGVLTQRQEGSGWGQIAQSLGVKLGSVVSASKTDKSNAGAKQSAHTNKADHSQTSEHAHHSGASASGRSGQGGGNSGGGGGGKK
jgi:hypothetical protein